MRILNKSKQTIISQQTKIADSILSRLIGLLERSSIDPQEALVITHCRAIHMFFMRFSIDVIFVDKNNRAIGLIARIKPFQISPYFFRSHYAIELPPGKIQETKTTLGDVIAFEQ